MGRKDRVGPCTEQSVVLRRPQDGGLRKPMLHTRACAQLCPAGEGFLERQVWVGAPPATARHPHPRTQHPRAQRGPWSLCPNEANLGAVPVGEEPARKREQEMRPHMHQKSGMNTDNVFIHNSQNLAQQIMNKLQVINPINLHSSEKE